MKHIRLYITLFCKDFIIRHYGTVEDDFMLQLRRRKTVLLRCMFSVDEQCWNYLGPIYQTVLYIKPIKPACSKRIGYGQTPLHEQVGQLVRVGVWP